MSPAGCGGSRGDSFMIAASRGILTCHRDGHRSAHAPAEPMPCEPIECRVHRRFHSRANAAWIVSRVYVVKPAQQVLCWSQAS